MIDQASLLRIHGSRRGWARDRTAAPGIRAPPRRELLLAGADRELSRGRHARCRAGRGWQLLCRRTRRHAGRQRRLDGGPARPGGPWRARIRAIFVHPDWARRGIGRRLVTQAETAAAQAGFAIFELEASLAGVPLYRSLGYREVARYGHAMADGATLPVVRMEKARAIAMAPCACG